MRASTLTALCCIAVIALFSIATPTVVRADTPANCTYPDFLGHWSLLQSSPIDSSYNCSDPNTTTTIQGVGFTLSYPNLVEDDNGVTGNWTLIYNQGIEVWLGQDIILLNSAFNTATQQSFCERTQYGWKHDSDGENWSCVNAQRTSESQDQKERRVQREKEAKKRRYSRTSQTQAAEQSSSHLDRPYHMPQSYLDAVNSAQSMFTVKHYPEYEHMTVRDMQLRAGGVSKASLHAQIPPPPTKHNKKSKKSKSIRTKLSSSLPTSFDWRNVSGVNYVTPVRDQGRCGSCYAFASAGMMESRIRLKSNFVFQPILSPQDVVSCSFYNQGCAGGFPYLVAGKYAHDFGMAEESCYPYIGNTTTCQPLPSQKDQCSGLRWYSDQYYYIGGYYGEATAENMQEELLANGPIVVGFEVYQDFLHYAGGVYTHNFTAAIPVPNPTTPPVHSKKSRVGIDIIVNGGGDSDYNPFHLVNHAVLVVGWGVTQDAAQTPYWIVKNSWGAKWGENGFFRILRGSSTPGGECAIESLTMAAIPIV